MTRWIHEFTPTVHASAPATDGRTVVFGTRDHSKPMDDASAYELVALNGDSGAVAWRNTDASAGSTPMIDGDLVYVSGPGFTRAVSLSDGHEVWRTPTANGAGIAARDGRIYTAKDSELIELDAASGKVLRRKKSGAKIQGLHIDDGGDVLVSGRKGWVTRIDGASFEVSRRYKPPGTWAIGHGPIATPTDDDLVIVSGYASWIAAFEAETGELRWKKRKEAGRVGAAIALGDGMALCTTPHLGVYRTVDGKRAWTLPGDVLHAVVCDERVIAVVAETPTSLVLRVIALRGGDLVGEQMFDVVEPPGYLRPASWSGYAVGLALGDAVAFASLPDGAVAAFDLPA